MSRNRLGAVVILGFSIAYGIIALHFPVPPAFNDSASPSSLPISLSAAGIIISMLILLFPTESVTTTQKLTPKGILRVSLLLLLMVSYGLSIEILGFWFQLFFFSVLAFG